MGDTATPAISSAPDAAAAAASKKSAAAKKAAVAKRSRKPTRPPTSEMVCNAIKSLKERGGSSLQAIKKYIGANYKVDAEKVSPFIRKYLKSAVAAGTLVQTKGKGASGSFKLAAASNASKMAAEDIGAQSVRKPMVKPKSTSKRLMSPKKVGVGAAGKKKARSADKKVKSAAKKSVIAEKKGGGTMAKSPSKLKRGQKGSPTKKPKAPKPKKTKPIAIAAKSPKKALAKKK